MISDDISQTKTHFFVWSYVANMNPCVGFWGWNLSLVWLLKPVGFIHQAHGDFHGFQTEVRLNALEVKLEKLIEEKHEVATRWHFSKDSHFLVLFFFQVWLLLLFSSILILVGEILWWSSCRLNLHPRLFDLLKFSEVCFCLFRESLMIMFCSCAKHCCYLHSGEKIMIVCERRWYFSQCNEIPGQSGRYMGVGNYRKTPAHDIHEVWVKRLCWKIPTLPQDSRPFFEKPIPSKKTIPKSPKQSPLTPASCWCFGLFFPWQWAPRL